MATRAVITAIVRNVGIRESVGVEMTPEEGELLSKKVMRWKSFVQCADSVTTSAWES